MNAPRYSSQINTEQLPSLPGDSNNLELIPQQFLFTGQSPPNPIIADDINQDGLIDIIARDGNSIIALVNTTPPGAEAPSFAAVQNIGASNGLWLESGEINGDGKIDFLNIDSSPYSDNWSFLNSTPTGSIDLRFNAILSPQINNHYPLQKLATGDLNGDGKLDLATVDTAKTLYSYLEARINNTPSWNLERVDSGAPYEVVIMEDINGDQRAEIISHDLYPGPHIEIFANRATLGSTDVNLSVNLDIPIEEKVQDILAVDVTGDGQKDLVAVSETQDKLFIWENNTPLGASTINFSSSTVIALPENLSLKDSGDFNQDGLLDLVLVNAEETALKIWLNNSSNGNISFSQGPELFLGIKLNDVATGDFNNDGISEIAVGKRTAASAGEILIVEANVMEAAIRGTSGNDYLDGTESNNQIFSLDGDDTIIAHSGDDEAYGGMGNDLLFGSRDRDILDGETGDDTLYGGKQDDILAGDANEDVIGGNDLLFGNRNSDRLFGGVGDDTLYGGKDNDSLVGQDGDDWLIGDFGSDTLIGEAGRDVFVLRLNSGVDEIVDFTPGEDIIGLSGDLTAAQLSIGTMDGLTTISAGDEVLATLGIDSSQLGSGDFLEVE